MEPLTPAQLYDRSKNRYHPCYRDGMLLVVPRLAEVPRRCVICNAAAPNTKAHNYSWRPAHSYIAMPLIFAVPFLMMHLHWAAAVLLIVAIVWYASATLRAVTVSYGHCREHQGRRDKLLWFGIGCVLQAMALLYLYGEGFDGSVIGLMCLFVLAAVGFFLRYARDGLRVQHANADLTRLKGCGEAFLASLPDDSTRPR